jgi:hypothetical protein
MEISYLWFKTIAPTIITTMLFPPRNSIVMPLMWKRFFQTMTVIELPKGHSRTQLKYP